MNSGDSLEAFITREVDERVVVSVVSSMQTLAVEGSEASAVSTSHDSMKHKGYPITN